jgi:hypothetical protein
MLDWIVGKLSCDSARNSVILGVGVSVEKEQYLDLETLAAAHSRETRTR